MSSAVSLESRWRVAARSAAHTGGGTVSVSAWTPSSDELLTADSGCRPGHRDKDAQLSHSPGDRLVTLRGYNAMVGTL